LRDGIVFLYASVNGGDIVSEHCRIVINRREATGISINRRRQTMSVDTTITLTANFRPAAASNRQANWFAVCSDHSRPNPLVSCGTTGALCQNPIVRVGLNGRNNIGVVQAVRPGVAAVVVTGGDTGSLSAEGTITVSSGPSSAIRIGRTSNFSVLGAGSRDRVEWFLDTIPTSPGGFGEGGTPIETVTANREEKPFTALTPATRGNAMRITAKTAGIEIFILTGRVMVPDPRVVNPQYPDDYIAVREQSWRVAAVNPISRMEMREAGSAERLKRLIISLPPNANRNNPSTLPPPIPLDVVITRPDKDATNLGFEWTVRANKRQVDEQGRPRPILEVPASTPPNENVVNTISVQALEQGTTRISGVNFNGRRRVNLSVRVLTIPTREQISFKKEEIPLKVGKTTGVRAKVTGAKGLDPRLVYELQGVTTNADGIASNSIVSLDTNKRRVTAVSPGTAVIVIRTPGNESSRQITIKVE
jgi:hypothetical protein